MEPWKQLEWISVALWIKSAATTLCNNWKSRFKMCYHLEVFLFLLYLPLIRERDLKDVHEGKYLFSFITFFTLSVRFPFVLTCINGKWLSSSMENYWDYCSWEVVCTLSPSLKTTEICTGTREEHRLFKHDRLTPPWHALEK